MEEIDITTLEFARRFKPFLRFDIGDIVYLKSDIKRKCALKIVNIELEEFNQDFDYQVQWINSKNEAKSISLKQNILLDSGDSDLFTGEEGFWLYYLKCAKSFKRYLRFDVGQIVFLKSDVKKEQQMTVEKCLPYLRDYDYVVVYITRQKSVKRKFLTNKELML